ncbi:MAG: glycosyltransferase family 2 protein [Alphaproteobacteria bacterium]|nr:glycosyltransferase family 2 protein [Alphaproteobacteria bacterium]OJV13671.1 MAG: hypothetical protein BGO27_00670 [Alphaproteobacteria bacterium 33-17]
MHKLSVFIITKNEEKRIAKVLDSISAIASEVIVVDSGSTDGTEEIVKSYGHKFVYNSWNGYEKQKIFGEAICSHDWILNIDADEPLSPELAGEIYNILKKESPEFNCYRIPIRIVHRISKHNSKFAPTNSPIRLYNKKYASFSAKKVTGLAHDSVFPKDAKEPVGKLKHPVYHMSLISIDQAVEKAHFVSTVQANDLIMKNRIPGRLRIVFELFAAFFKAYILRRYFLFGFDGFVDSAIFAFARFLRLAKAREYYLTKVDTSRE